MSDQKRGWELLHSKLPPAAIKELATSVYGVAGLSDVNEGFLIQRLWASGMTFEWRVIRESYLGFEDRTSSAGKPYRVYMFSVHGAIDIEGRSFHGVGASENRKLDAAMKGANTVAFKQACKPLGMTAELYLDGRAIDHIYSERVLKDQTMVPEQRIEAIVEWAEKSQEASGTGHHLPSPPASSEASEQVQDTFSTPSQESPSPVPAQTGELDLTDLFSLARTLRTPATNIQVTNEVARNGFEAVRKRLIFRHNQDCPGPPPCIHVAELAGLKV